MPMRIKSAVLVGGRGTPKPRAGSKIMKNPKNPLTTQWKPAKVRKTASGDIQVLLPLGKAVKSVAVVASRTKRKVKRVVRRVARKNPAKQTKREWLSMAYDYGNQQGAGTRGRPLTGRITPAGFESFLRSERKLGYSHLGTITKADLVKEWKRGYRAGVAKKNPVKRKATRKTARKNPLNWTWHSFANDAEISGRRYGRAATRSGNKPTNTFERWWSDVRPQMDAVAARKKPTYKVFFMRGYRQAKR